MNERCLIVLFFILITQLWAAQEPTCYTHSAPGKTTYQIQMKLSDEEHDCEYSWNNCTDYVLANRVGQDNTLVLTHTNTSLVTSVCIEVIYKVNCVSGPPRTVNCDVNCTEALKNHSIKWSLCSTLSMLLTFIMTVLK